MIPALVWELPLYVHLSVLIVVISLVRAATHFDRPGRIVREALKMSLTWAGIVLGVMVVLFLYAQFT